MGGAPRSARPLPWAVPVLFALAALLLTPTPLAVARAPSGTVAPSGGSAPAASRPTSEPGPPSGGAVVPSSSVPRSPSGPVPALDGTFLGPLLARLPGAPSLAVPAPSAFGAVASAPAAAAAPFGVASTLDLTSGRAYPGNVLPDNCAYPMGTLFVPSVDEVYVLCFGSGNVSLGETGEVLALDPSTGAVDATILTGIGEAAARLVETPGGPIVAVADALANEVSLIDPQGATVRANVTVGVRPIALAVDNASALVFVADYGNASVSVVNASSGRLDATIPVGLEPDALAFNASSGELFVACAGTSQVDAIDVASLAVRQVIGVGQSPVALAVDGPLDELLVANEDSDNVSEVAISNDTVVRTLPVATPFAVAVDPMSGEAFVASESTESIATIAPNGSLGTPIVLGTPGLLAAPIALTVDAASGLLYADALTEAGGVPASDVTLGGSIFPVRLADGTVGPPTAVGDALFNLLEGIPLQTGRTSPANTLFVAGSGGENVTEIDGATGGALRTVALGDLPRNLTADAVDGKLYVLNEAPNSVLVLNARTETIEASVPLPGLYNSFAMVDPWTGDLLVGGLASSALAVIGASSNALAGSIPGIGQPSQALADPVNGQLYVGGPYDLYAINGATEQRIVTLPGPVRNGPESLALDPYHDRLFASSGPVVRVLNGSTDAVVANWSIPGGAGAIAVDNATGVVFVTEPADGAVAVFDAATLQEWGTIPGVADPVALTVDRSNGALYVADGTADQVTVIDPTTLHVSARVATPTVTAGLQVDPATGNVVLDEPGYSKLSVVAETTPRLIANLSLGIVPSTPTFDPETDGFVTANEASGTASFLASGGPGWPVTFTESSLPSGTPWSVSLGGSTNATTASSLTFLVPNGTYAYTAGALDASASPPFGNVSVSGGPRTIAVAFLARTRFPVTFDERGLPVDTAWSVEVDGVAVSSSGSSVALPEPNGRYLYRAPNVTGFAVSPSAGAVRVAGSAPAAVVLTYTRVFAVTFSGVHLPPAFLWGVQVRFANLSTAYNVSPSATIGFSLPNGSYSYLVSASSPGAVPQVASGGFSVLAAPLGLDVTFVGAYDVTFVAGGLPAAERWSVSVNGTSTPGNGPTVNVSLPNGTYGYAAYPPAGYAPDPTEGTFVVDGSGRLVRLSFYPAPGDHLVTFSETGLPAGVSWTVGAFGVDGSASGASTRATISFSLPTGAYGFAVDVGAPGYAPFPSTGEFSLAGSNLTVAVQVSRVYPVRFEESGLQPGAVWGVGVGSANASSSTAWVNLSLPNGVYAFSVSASAGYTADPASGSLTVANGSVEESVVFSVSAGYEPVTVTETGLPSGGSWQVDLGGVLESGSGRAIVFLEPPGTYSLSVAPEHPYAVGPVGPTVTVDLGPVVVAVLCYPSFGYHTVTIVESGLPTGVNWTASTGLNLSLSAVAPAPIVLALPNASYVLSARTTDRHYGAAPLPFVVAGANVTLTAEFSVTVFSVEVAESGLPAGTVWWFNVTGGTSYRSGSATVGFSDRNGSYGYTLASANRSWASARGSFAVHGTAVSLLVTFALVTYAVTFVERGLPHGLAWAVNVTGWGSVGGSTPSVERALPNGSYNFTFWPSNRRWVMTSTDAFEVAGGPVTIGVTASEAFVIEFLRPDGTPAGATWSVTVSDSTVPALWRGAGGLSVTNSSVGPDLWVLERNGTYPYAVTVLGDPGYSAGGSVTVDGRNVTVTPAALHGASGGALSPSDDELLLGTGATVAVAAVLLLLGRRRRTPPRGPPEPFRASPPEATPTSPLPAGPSSGPRDP
ncbi:MAG TPA: YncE family protein [Thermoplasmata archaeon]|nr:YncE family protein [Thermoplasmata archaeon]